MERDESWTILAVLVAAMALVGLVAAILSLATPAPTSGWTDWGMGGEHGVTPGSGVNVWGWVLLAVSLAFLAIAVGLLASGRGRLRTREPAAPGAVGQAFEASAHSPLPVAPAGDAPVPSSPPKEPLGASSEERLPELTLMRLLNEDERRMYLEVREHGGEMTQRDIVRLGVFSRPKVSRVLDRLETKGIVVREPNGMTNRVRIVGNVGR